MLSTQITRFRLLNMIAGSVGKCLQKPEQNSESFCEVAEDLLQKYVTDDFDNQIDVSLFPLKGIDFQAKKVVSPESLIHSCMNRAFSAEEMAHQTLTLALAIDRFRSSRDLTAAREVQTLKERGHTILKDLGHEMIDRKVMFQSTRMLTANVIFALENDDSADGAFINTVVRPNETGEVVVVYFPASSEERLLSEISGIVGIDIGTLQGSVRPCDEGVVGYMFVEDYPLSNPQNIISERYNATEQA